MKRSILVIVSLALATACGNDSGTADPHQKNNGTTNGSTNNGSTNGETNGATNGTTNGSTNNASTNGSTNNSSQNNTDCEALDPAIGPCDVICQTGCEIGEHCLAESPNEGDPYEALCASAGIRGQGEACNADTECGLGLHCRNVGGEDKICSTYCAPDRSPTGCPTNHGCVRTAGDSRIGACIEIVDECEAVPDDTCADPEECYDTVTGRKCLPAGDRPKDDPCSRSSECQPGLRCVSFGDQPRECETLCDPNGADTCADDQTCQTLENSAGQTLSWGACF